VRSGSNSRILWPVSLLKTPPEQESMVRRPSPDRPLSWTTFVRSHAHLIAAADFFTTEVWTARGLVRHFTLFVIDIATRRVHGVGTTNPTSAWMEQMARNLADCEEG